jgi:hypothetical protein
MDDPRPETKSCRDKLSSAFYNKLNLTVFFIQILFYVPRLACPAVSSLLTVGQADRVTNYVLLKFIMNDMPQLKFDWANQTSLHPLGLAAVIILGLAMLALPRRWAVLPMVLMACFIPPGQRIVLWSLNFDLLRVLVLCGWVRLLFRGENRQFVFKPIDAALIAWAVTATIVYSLALGSLEGMKYKLGTSFDALGMYFLFRCLIRDWQDLDQAIKCFILVSVPVAIAFGIESMTGKNVFSIFGYVPADTMIRQERLRCQGAFAHPILAGSFWASMMPLIAARWWAGTKQHVSTLVGLAASGLIILFCASSTPVFAVVIGLVGAALFPLRYYMRWIRWGVFLTLVELHLVMKAPVWHLLSRADILHGSTGWHRFYLINETVNRFGEWWFLGTLSTAHWGRGLFDVTNQYVLEGVRGGVWTLVLFLVVIALAFGSVGRLWRSVDRDQAKLAMSWALGVALFIHCMTFLAVSYFGQIILVWYLLLAMIGSLSPVRTAVPVQPTRVIARSTRRSNLAFMTGDLILLKDRH